MKKLALLSLLLVVGCSPRGAIRCTEMNVAEVRQAVLEDHNKLRKSRLEMVDELIEVAQHHADWMALHNNLDHTGEHRSNVMNRVRDNVGDKYSTVGENIAQGQETNSEVMDAWMKSPGHKQNILNRDFTRMGVGIGFSRKGTIFWCVVFAG